MRIELDHLFVCTAPKKMVESGVLATQTGATYLLEIEFDGHQRKEQKEQVDFRPHLPVLSFSCDYTEKIETQGYTSQTGT